MEVRRLLHHPTTRPRPAFAPLKTPQPQVHPGWVSNLKKELSILSPLKHTHVIQLYGVMLHPLGEREGGRERERGGGRERKEV